jgi:hypothetical protein
MRRRSMSLEVEAGDDGTELKWTKRERVGGFRVTRVATPPRGKIGADRTDDGEQQSMLVVVVQKSDDFQRVVERVVTVSGL